jgi:hypothetical protein
VAGDIGSSFKQQVHDSRFFRMEGFMESKCGDIFHQWEQPLHLTQFAAPTGFGKLHLLFKLRRLRFNRLLRLRNKPRKHLDWY